MMASKAFLTNQFRDLAEEVNRLVDDLMKGNINPNRNPESIFQFHPISFCNYSYKILLKVMVNHLRLLLPELIFLSQNAFVAGR